MLGLSKNVLVALQKIPKGKVTTYGALARLFNTSPRAIGQIMKRNTDPVNCPCYKVVMSSGYVGGYSGKTKGEEIEKKIRLLKKDGIVVKNGTINRKYFWYFTVK